MPAQDDYSIDLRRDLLPPRDDDGSETAAEDHDLPPTHLDEGHEGAGLTASGAAEYATGGVMHDSPEDGWASVLLHDSPAPRRSLAFDPSQGDQKWASASVMSPAKKDVALKKTFTTKPRAKKPSPERTAVKQDKPDKPRKINPSGGRGGGKTSSKRGEERRAAAKEMCRRYYDEEEGEFVYDYNIDDYNFKNMAKLSDVKGVKLQSKEGAFKPPTKPREVEFISLGVKKTKMVEIPNYITIKPEAKVEIVRMFLTTVLCPPI